MITAFASSLGLVAASEMGDKTQLLAFSLAARFKKPIPILLGILVATALNHALAAGLGGLLAAQIPARVLRWILAVLFFGFGVWTLKPDTLEEPEEKSKWGAFWTTCILFFIAEMGDKTQLATVALGARFQSLGVVTAGTTLGMMLADGMAVFAGHSLTDRLPMHWVRRGAAVLFFLFGLGALGLF